MTRIGKEWEKQTMQLSVWHFVFSMWVSNAHRTYTKLYRDHCNCTDRAVSFLGLTGLCGFEVESHISSIFWEIFHFPRVACLFLHLDLDLILFKWRELMLIQEWYILTVFIFAEVIAKLWMCIYYEMHWMISMYVFVNLIGWQYPATIYISQWTSEELRKDWQCELTYLFVVEVCQNVMSEHYTLVVI